MTDHRRSNQIEREIDATRADLDESVRALSAKLSPGEIVDELWNRFGKGGSGASGLSDTLRDHPVPLALMGLGLGWLAIESATGGSRSKVGPGTYGRAEGRVGPYRGDAVTDGSGRADGLKAKASGAAERVSDKASQAANRISDKASDAADSVTGKASSLKDDVSEKAHRLTDRGSSDGAGYEASGAYGESSGGFTDHASESLEHYRDRARASFWSALEEQPLALGAVAFGLGLLGGSSAPTTDAENEMFGRTAGTLKHEAKDAVREHAESAKAVATDVARDVKAEVKDGDLGADLKQKAEQVADRARQTAKDSAKKEGLTAEGIKRDATEVADKTRDEASREAERQRG